MVRIFCMIKIRNRGIMLRAGAEYSVVTISSVTLLRRTDLQTFFRKHCSSQNTVVSCSRYIYIIFLVR